LKKILVTGALGFIGSHFIKYTLENHKDYSIIGFDKETNPKLLKRLEGIETSKFNLIHGDLCSDISELLEGVDIVVHFAARTFVDHSFREPYSHFKNTVYATYSILEQVRKFKQFYKKDILFVHISTDEVYGQIEEGFFKEKDILNPTNPYSACKGGAEMIVKGWGNAYKIPYIITRCENVYGSHQHPQKVLPVFVKKAVADEALPLYGDGRHKRMWLRVEDKCSALWYLINRDARGIYNIAGGQELENIELANIVFKTLGKPDGKVTYIPDNDIRPVHDRRYGIDSSKLNEMGWRPKYDLEKGLGEVIQWFADNPNWSE